MRSIDNNHNRLAWNPKTYTWQARHSSPCISRCTCLRVTFCDWVVVVAAMAFDRESPSTFCAFARRRRRTHTHESTRWLGHRDVLIEVHEPGKSFTKNPRTLIARQEANDKKVKEGENETRNEENRTETYSMKTVRATLLTHSLTHSAHSHRTQNTTYTHNEMRKHCGQ